MASESIGNSAEASEVTRPWRILNIWPVAHLCRGPNLRDFGKCRADANRFPGVILSGAFARDFPARLFCGRANAQSKDLLLRHAVMPITAPRTRPSHTRHNARRSKAVLRLHSGQQVAHSLHRHHASPRRPNRPTQGRRLRRIYQQVQNLPPCLFRALLLGQNRDCPRETTQGLGSSEEDRPNRTRQSHVGRSRRGVGNSRSFDSRPNYGRSLRMTPSLRLDVLYRLRADGVPRVVRG